MIISKEAHNLTCRKYYQKNKDKEKIRSRKKYLKNRKKLIKQSNIARDARYTKRPWFRFLDYIKDRCNNKNRKKFRRYGGRGIQCLITEEELKFLWFRDKAYNLKFPSIDRKDNDKSYELSNCRFIELLENGKKGSKLYDYLTHSVQN